MVLRFAVLVTLATPVVVAAPSAATPAGPRPLRGVPLSGATSLRLLVANNPPFVLDVDTGRKTRIGGLKLGRRALVGVHRVGRDGIVSVEPTNRVTKVPRADIYLIRHGATRATPLTTAWQVGPSDDGTAIWLKSYLNGTQCTLREVALDGSERQGPRSIPCSTELVDTGSRSLLVDGGSVLDPSTGETILRATYLWTATADFAVTTEALHGPLAVTDLRSGNRWHLRYPSRIAGQGGVDEAVVHPKGRLVALSFSDPAYNLTAIQVTDLWLLDVATRGLRQLPDMPAAVALKFTSMKWASDGRLVILAETLDNRNQIAVWRPGRKRIRLRPVQVHAQHGDFIVW